MELAWVKERKDWTSCLVHYFWEKKMFYPLLLICGCALDSRPPVHSRVHLALALPSSDRISFREAVARGESGRRTRIVFVERGSQRRPHERRGGWPHAGERSVGHSHSRTSRAYERAWRRRECDCTLDGGVVARLDFRRAVTLGGTRCPSHLPKH